MIKRLFPFLLLPFLVAVTGTLSAAKDTFETLKIGRTTYTNVTVLNRTKTDVFISHTGGLVSFKINALGAEDLGTLGYRTPEAAKPGALTAKVEALTANMGLDRTNGFIHDLRNQYPQLLKSSGISLGTILALGLGTALLLHLFYSFCLRMICRKVNTEPGKMIWLPILQLIPMHRAARISPWLILFYLLPPIGFFVFVFWSVKICQARGKSAWLVILIFVPILNLLFIPFLAFSSAAGKADKTPQSVEMS